MKTINAILSWKWNRHIQTSIEVVGLPEPKVAVLESPYRKVVSPILDYIWKLERENPDETVVVLIPQLIEAHWYYSFLPAKRTVTQGRKQDSDRQCTVAD